MEAQLTHKSALNNIKVIEFADTVSGQYCGKMLADMGADVIKVEPKQGDPLRSVGPFPDNKSHPERSALFLYNNTNKRSVALDLNQSNDLGTFRKLIKGADILIDTHHPHHLENFNLDWKTLHNLNPGLVYTSITPYGRTGPRTNNKGDELTLIHAGGLGNLLPARSVNINRPPVKLGGYPVGYHGGIAAAMVTLSVFLGRKKTGKGHLIDISLQEVILNLVSPMVASNRYHKTTWCRVPDRPPAMGRMQTSDGYVILGAWDDHHFRAFRELMGKPEWVAGDEWDDMGYRRHHSMDIAPLMDEWMLKQKKYDIYHKAAKKGIPIGPIATAKDVMNDQQYKARDYFVEVDHPEAGKYRYAGWPYKMSVTPPRVKKPAPLLGRHNEEILSELKSSITDRHENIKHGKKAADTILPLKGLRVLDFCWVWAGPYATKILADLGAEVIKIEGHTRTDLTRRTFPWPLPDPAPTLCPPNQGMVYNSLNQNKKSLTLDLSKPEGLRIVKKLIAISDVVIDNMRPGAMIKLGLGYEELCKVRSDIIAVTSSSRGHEGPEYNYLGFATVHQGIAGVAHLTGHPDDHPSHGSPGDADIMNATSTAFAIVAALHYHAQTGKGQFIDYSQCEGVTSLIGEALLGYEMTSKIPERMGNAHFKYAPHGVYKSWGVDRWIALEIHSNKEFAKFVQIIGQPELFEDPRFADNASRKKNESELNHIIESWTKERDRDWVVSKFCKAGLFAAPSRDVRDLYADPHLKERKAFVAVDHPETGRLELVGPPWKVSDIEMPTNCAPLLGEHNEYVLKELLNINDKDIFGLREKKIIL